MLPQPQDLSQSLAQYDNSVQLTTGSQGDARVVFAQVAPGSRLPSGTDTDQEILRQMKRKVAYLAIALASAVVFQQFIVYMFNIAETEAAITEIKEELPKDLDTTWLPNLCGIIVGSFPKMVFSVLLSLSVPLCGYLGVKQSSPTFMRCFCCCNFFGSCMTILSMVVCCMMLMFVNGAEPELLHWFQECDPAMCMTGPAGVPYSRNQTIDCLAAPAPGYTPKYEGVLHLPQMCPPLFLTCKVDPEWQRLCSSHFDQYGCRSVPNDKCVWMEIREGACVPNDGSAIVNEVVDAAFTKSDTDFERRLSASTRDFMAQDGSRAYGSSGYGRSSVYQRPARSPWGTHKAEHNPLELPKDPQAKCEVDNKRVETFEAIKKLIPKLSPMLVAVIMVRLVLAVPVTILGCFGFIWGKDLYDKLNAGYASIAAPAYVGQPMFVQPQQQHIPGHGAPAPYAVMVQPMPVTGVPLPQGQQLQQMQQASAPPTA